ncbi:amidohydrolase family protein [Dyella sp. C9]|uniref:amidohydrolase family protein n=1 Tax=Dyella sp. C9 TaxID=2202154 RepID=UPI000DEF90CD|nr:amidohydrolase family protein [Dyella sp. C9]
MTIQLHTCGNGCADGCAAPELARTAVARRDPSLTTIDVHCHAFVPAVEDLVTDHPGKQQEMAAFAAGQGRVSGEHNRTVMLPQAFPRMTNPSVRLADMDAMGVDVQVIGPSPSQNYYWADPELARRIVSVQNEGIAALCAAYPSRMLGFANVALQHPELAAAQLDHAVRELGFRGVQISSAVAGVELSDPRFAPFWARAESLDCVVFIHPFGTTLGSRLEPWYLSNIIGQPLETTIALSHLIFSGVLDRHPRLKLLGAHGGGYLPSYPGRSDHGYRVRPEAGQASRAPSSYLRQIWFDTLVADPSVLRGLIARYGASQLVVGTDYPFDMGAYDIHAMLDEVPGLDADRRRQILGGNAARLLGLHQDA